MRPEIQMELQNDAEIADLPKWVPQDAARYLVHTRQGVGIRELSRRLRCHASTVSRQIRKIEARRDDPLIDAALSRLGKIHRTDPIHCDEEIRPMTTHIPPQTFTPTEATLAREGRRILRRLAETGAVLAVALASPLSAQDHTPQSYSEWILDQFGEIQNRFHAGERFEAYEAALELDAEVDQYADFMEDHQGFWYPDLLVARLAVRIGEYPRAEMATAPMVVALDTPDHRVSKLRLEALNLLDQLRNDTLGAGEP